MLAEPAPLTPEQEATLDVDRGPSIVAVTSLFIGLTTVAVLLRFASRFSRQARFGADDWLSVAALIFEIGFCITTILSVKNGMGKHVWAVDLPGSWRIIQIGYYNAVIRSIARFLTRMALLFLYRRVFTMNVKWFRYTWYAVSFYILGLSIVFFILTVFQCIPPSYFWERFNPSLNPPAQGFCRANIAHYVIASAAVSIPIEVALFILPIRMLSQLQLKSPQKIGLMLIFGTGALAIGAEAARLHFALTAGPLNVDITWVTTDIYLWTAITDSVALICACLPTFGPIIATTKDVVSSYVTELSLSRNAKSRVSLSQARSWSNSTVAGAVDNRAVQASTPMTRLKKPSSQGQQGILRTDEYILETYPRTDEFSLHNYHDPTQSIGGRSTVGRG